MDIILGRRLRELRAQRKQTQEQLAVHLGITTQAVSKWERGEGLPELTMLPAIASFFNVSVDYLLGVDEAARRCKLEEYESQSKTLSSAQEKIALWRVACREFPNEPTVLHNLSFALRADSMEAHREEIMALAQRLLKEAKRSGEYFGAINNLCRTYADLGDMKEAKRYAAMAGRYVGTENQLMIQILQGEEAAAFCQWNIQTLADLISTNAAVMLKKGEYTPEEQIHIGQQILRLFAVIYEDGGYGFYHCRVSKWYMRLGKNYARLGDRQETLHCLERAVYHAAAYDALEQGRYTALIVNRQQFSKASNGGKCIADRQREMQDVCFDFLKEDVQFQKLLG